MDHRLASLCKLSKLTWKRWKTAGHPTHGLLHGEKQDAAHAVNKMQHMYMLLDNMSLHVEHKEKDQIFPTP